MGWKGLCKELEAPLVFSCDETAEKIVQFFSGELFFYLRVLFCSHENPNEATLGPMQDLLTSLYCCFRKMVDIVCNCPLDLLTLNHDNPRLYLLHGPSAVFVALNETVAAIAMTLSRQDCTRDFFSVFLWLVKGDG